MYASDGLYPPHDEPVSNHPDNGETRGNQEGKREASSLIDYDSAEITIRKQIEQLVHLNGGQHYAYDRNMLVKMLDEALVQARPKTQ